jgi:hypothetical protein
MAPHPAPCSGCGGMVDVDAAGDELGTPGAGVGAVVEGIGTTVVAISTGEGEIGGGGRGISGGGGGGIMGGASDELGGGGGARMEAFFSPSRCWRAFPPLPRGRRPESPAGGGSMATGSRAVP